MDRFYLLFLPFFLCSHITAQQYQNIAPAQNIFDSYGSNSRYGGGLSCYDFDQDGWDDLTLIGNQANTIHFYKNVEGSFQLVSLNLPNLPDRAKQALWADVDNDGDEDLLITADTAANHLYLNDGTFYFTLQVLPEPIGAGAGSMSFGAAFGDYDRDGDLDLFICNYSWLFNPYPNQLLRNDGGMFTDVTSNYFMDTLYATSFAVSFWDYNHDLWPDIHVVNDRAPENRLFRNDGNTVFSDQSAASGMNISVDGMCSTFGDYDNDGDLDMNVTALGTFLLDQQTGTFTERSDSVGLTYNRMCWSSCFLDYDNDGWQDLYLASGFYPLRFANKLYKNQQDGNFQLAVNAGFLNDSMMSYGASTGDFNNDGYPDIAVSQVAPDQHALWQSSGGNNNYLKIRLHGIASNLHGVGSWVHIYSNGQAQHQYTACGTGYLSQNSQDVFFGLDTSTVVDSLVIEWISGQVDTYYHLEGNQRLLFIEGLNWVNAGEPSPTLDSLSFCLGDSAWIYSDGSAEQPLGWSLGWEIEGVDGSKIDYNLGIDGDSLLLSYDSLIAWGHEPGEYSLRAVAYNGLGHIFNRSNQTIFLRIAADFELQSQFYNPSTPAGTDGNILVEILGDTTYNYQFIWSDTNLVGPNPMNLCAGNYYLTVTDALGCNPQVDSFVLTDPPLSWSISEESLVTVYPNPMLEELFLKNETAAAVRGVIYNLKGQLVQKVYLPKQTVTRINVKNFVAGSYLLKLNNGKVFKLLKER